MKFILVVTDTHGKNLAFVSRELQILSLSEATEAVRHGDVTGAYVVERKTGAYIRSKKSVPKLEQFEKIAVPFKNLLLYVQGVRSAENIPALKTYTDLFTLSLKTDQPFITLAGQPPWKVLTADTKTKVIPQRANIFASADKFNIDLTKRPDIIGTLYSQGYGKPKSNPEANERGTQIATEFYSLAKQWLTGL